MEDILKNNNTPKQPPGSEYEVKEPIEEGLESVWTRCKCLVCGYVYEGAQECKKCPKCGNEDPDKFVDAE